MLLPVGDMRRMKKSDMPHVLIVGEIHADCFQGQGQRCVIIIVCMPRGVPRRFRVARHGPRMEEPLLGRAIQARIWSNRNLVCAPNCTAYVYMFAAEKVLDVLPGVSRCE